MIPRRLCSLRWPLLLAVAVQQKAKPRGEDRLSNSGKGGQSVERETCILHDHERGGRTPASQPPAIKRTNCIAEMTALMDAT